MSNLPRKAEPRSPGWLSRHATPLLAYGRALPFAQGHHLLSVARSTRLRAFYTTLRPLAHNVLSIARTALAHWNLTPRLIRPWWDLPAHDLWLGRVPRYAYRLRRATAQGSQARGARRSTSGRPVDESSEGVLPLPYPEAEAPLLEPSLSFADQPDEIARAAQQEWLVAGDGIEPLSLPREWLTITRPARSEGEALAPATALRRVESREFRAAPSNAARVHAGSSMRAASAGTLARARRDTPLFTAASSTESPTDTPTPARPLPLLDNTAQGTPAGLRGEERRRVAAPNLTGMAGISRAAQQTHGQPDWPFHYVTPLDIARAADEPSELAEGYDLPTLTFARAQTLASARTFPWRSLVQPMPSQMQVLERMLAHVPEREPPGAPAAGGFETRVPAAVLARAARSAEVRLSAPLSARARVPGMPVAGMPIPVLPSVAADAITMSGLSEAPGAETRAAARQLEPQVESEVGSAARLAASEPAVEAQVAREFPLLSFVRQMAREPAAAEPAAMQVLRRMSSAQVQRALQRMADLPSLGRGEPLPLGVRRPMELLLQRDLSSVQTHTSSVAEELGAEAFTTGEHIVFAPGRMNLRSARGLALVGHELAHVGQSLAFKQTGDSGASDPEERAAHRHEQQVLHIIEHGWQDAPRMEVRQAAQGLAALSGAAQSAPAGSSPLSGFSVQRAANESVQRESAPATDESPAVSGRLSEAPATPAGAGAGGSPAEVDKLAREVYNILKSRLRAERMRHQVY